MNTPARSDSGVLLVGSLCFSIFAIFIAPVAYAADEAPARVLIVVGPTKHPPGSHEVAAGGRLIKGCLDGVTNVRGIKADVFNEWPADKAVRDSASTIVFMGDQFPPMRLPDSAKNMADLAAMMDRGCGIVCVHYATGLADEDVSPDGEHPLLHWTGGYFATKCKHHQSVARLMTATITPGDAKHPVLRGWKEFTLSDEPYYNNYFGKDGMAPGVVALATSMLPPEKPTQQVVAWATQRKDGGRGMGVVMPHYYKNWKIDDLRKFIMNGIVWTAKLEVPADGVQTPSPDLAAYHPVSIEPQPREKKPEKPAAGAKK